MGLLQDQKDSSRFANQSMQYNVIQHTNKRKDKNHMIISINAEKKHLIEFKFIHVKNSHYSEYRGNISQQYKSHYDKPTANFILNGEKLKNCCFDSGTKQRCPISSLLFNIVLEVLAKIIRKGRETKPSILERKR